MFDNMKFYHGSQNDYIRAADGGLLDDCFYWTYEQKEGEEIGKYIYRLYLKDKLIFSDNLSETVGDILKVDKVQKEFAKYVLLNKTEQQTITSPVYINGALKAKNLEIDGSIKVNNIINAGNYIYSEDEEKNGTVTIPCKIITDKIATFNGGLSSNQINTTEINADKGIIKLDVLSFNDKAQIIALPDYKVNDWSYNFNSGDLTVNSIEAKQIKIGGALVSTENKDVLVVPQIQIGNLLLSEDENGNLKITSVKTVRLTEE